LTENSFPVMLVLGGRRVVVVGGGATAEDKVRLLMAAGAEITVVSPRLTAHLERLARHRMLRWHRRAFVHSDVADAFLVVAATDDPMVNQAVFEAADAATTLCNAVDDPANCSAILPSVHRDGPLVVAVSTSGAAPALAVRLRQRIAEVTSGYGEILGLLAGFRHRIKDTFATFDERREVWYRIVDSPAVEMARTGHLDGAAAAIGQLIDALAPGSPDMLQSPVDRADRRIRETLEWAGNPVVTVSGQLGGLVLVDLIRRHRPDIEVVFVDTGYHPPESVDFIHRVATEWHLNLTVAQPDIDVAAHEAQHGPLYLTDPAQCCRLRKLIPAEAGLAGHDVWFSAVRNQSETRRDETALAAHHFAAGSLLWKVSPLVDWTWSDVEAYASAHRIPSHPLYERGYTSIGCAPCTIPTFGVNDDRAGRWNGTDRLECGLHIARPGPSGAS
jgi:phosphoadenylyl-sulfate reductase (thioredoxin)